MAIALFTFLYVDLLDTTATLFAMARYAKMLDPVTGDFEGSTKVRREGRMSCHFPRSTELFMSVESCWREHGV